MPGFPPGVHRKGGQNSAVVHAAAARAFYAPLIPIVAELRRRGLSLRAIAGELDRRGIKTRQEWEHWSATQVRRVLARAALPSASGAPPRAAADLLADLTRQAVSAENVTPKKEAAADLLADLTRQGITLTVESRIIYVAPGDRLTEDLRQTIRANCKGLLDLLRQRGRAARPGG